MSEQTSVHIEDFKVQDVDADRTHVQMTITVRSDHAEEIMAVNVLVEDRREMSVTALVNAAVDRLGDLVSVVRTSRRGSS